MHRSIRDKHSAKFHVETTSASLQKSTLDATYVRTSLRGVKQRFLCFSINGVGDSRTSI
jgi:hypothetical protein